MLSVRDDLPAFKWPPNNPGTVNPKASEVTRVLTKMCIFIFAAPRAKEASWDTFKVREQAKLLSNFGPSVLPAGFFAGINLLLASTKQESNVSYFPLCCGFVFFFGRFKFTKQNGPYFGQIKSIWRVFSLPTHYRQNSNIHLQTPTIKLSRDLLTNVNPEGSRVEDLFRF